MIQITLYILSIIMGMIFIQMNHPLAMGLMLLIQTFLVCLISGLITKTFWFSYILFLIFLGGMLVLFIYVTSLASNEMFSLSMKLTINTIIMFFFSFFIILFMDKSLIMPFLPNMEMININFMENYLNENSINLNKLYNFPTNIITLLLINYLLLTLIVIVKITNLYYGPLRQMN
uniref:NADH dehydrogenase subunit 6 n=1 Tax=Symphoromyia crassicornis TaxID=1842026 RepID=UPI0020291751|nr:NADH dehydrogenase subunit 6 [Symphoromyia crassicornis]UQU69103.1 NADH dehydrogenase subunit 6 [Symphoromyia crassicornis]